MTFEDEKQKLNEELCKRLNEFRALCEKECCGRDGHVKEEVSIRRWYASELEKLAKKYNMI